MLKLLKTKHKDISLVAKSKSNSIKAILLKIIQELRISDKQYKCINNEVKKKILEKRLQLD